MQYFYDNRRHLVCKPFSVENLHAMAVDLNIKRCWYHGGSLPHYDIPKRRVAEITEHATLVTEREIYRIIRGLPSGKD